MMKRIVAQDYDSDFDGESKSNAMDCRVESASASASAKRAADTDAGGDQKRQKLSNALMRTNTTAVAAAVAAVAAVTILPVAAVAFLAKQTLVVLGPTTPPPIQESTQELLLKHNIVRRVEVNSSFAAATARNERLYMEKNPNATEEYIFPNQWADATKIVELFYKTMCLAVSVWKKTKVGADGVMLATIKRFATHPDDTFLVPINNIYIITAMSNTRWEKDMIAKAPSCLKEMGKIQICHHGKLKKAHFENLKNAVIIIDEMDVANKAGGVMHKKLQEARLLDAEYLKAHNIKLVLISATFQKEVFDLHQWGTLHQHVKMTIPDSYIGHKEFLEMGIIQEFYSLNTKEAAEKWVQEDVLGYKDDHRVHIVRVDDKTTTLFIKSACALKDVDCESYDSKGNLTPEKKTKYFERPLIKHVVLMIKGYLRRGELLNNDTKMRIGAVHEYYTIKPDYSVQVQGLTGRMTGHWRAVFEGPDKHKVGPIRSSIKGVQEYLKCYDDPHGPNNYQSAGYQMINGEVVKTTPTIFSPRHVLNLPGAAAAAAAENPAASYRIYSDEETTKAVFNILGYRYRSPEEKNAQGFYMTSLHHKREVASLENAIKRVPDAIKKGRTYYPCYADTTNILTLKFVVIFPPTLDKALVAECDDKFPHEIYAVAAAAAATT